MGCVFEYNIFVAVWCSVALFTIQLKSSKYYNKSQLCCKSHNDQDRNQYPGWFVSNIVAKSKGNTAMCENEKRRLKDL